MLIWRVLIFCNLAEVDESCESVSSTNRSLTFRWKPVKSAISYRLVGHSKDKSYTTTEVTVDDLTPGSFYTFTVTAIGSGGLESNSIRCANSTGESRFVTININPRFVIIILFRFICIRIHAYDVNNVSTATLHKLSVSLPRQSGNIKISI